MAAPQVVARPSPVVKQSQPTLQKEQGQSNSGFLTNSPVPLAPPLLSEDEVNSLNEQLGKANNDSKESGESNNTGENNGSGQSQVSNASPVVTEEGIVGCEEPHKENAEETTKRIQDKLNEIVSVTPINSSGPSHNCAHCGGIAGFIVKKIIVNGWIKRLCVTCTNKVLQQTFEELLALEPKPVQT